MSVYPVILLRDEKGIYGADAKTNGILSFPERDPVRTRPLRNVVRFALLLVVSRRSGSQMRRRDFITLLGGVTAGWPFAARAQQPRARRIGVLMSTTAEDPFGQACSAAFAQGLQQLGWEIGGNIRIDYRWGAGDTERFRKYAVELVALSPDVILGTAASIVGALQQASRTVPIVFVTTIDPVGSGLVASLAHPGGNATGFSAFEFSLSAKLLELVKQVAPNVTRVAVVRDLSVAAGSGGFAAIQTAAILTAS
jgi:putative ABC transport system substrate-binding protein